MIVAVSGADGFIGAPLCTLLTKRGHHVKKLVRRSADAGADRYLLDHAVETSNSILEGVDAVLHLAGRAHVLATEPDSSASFERDNVELTRVLTARARSAGVKRFVFMSSIGVNGGATHGHPFSELDEPTPLEPYARTKLRAEQVVREQAGHALEVVVVRPPLVYGPNPKGNLQRLIRLLDMGVPLPFASIRNRRNIVSLDNLCDALTLCLVERAAAGETFLVAEPEPRSTPEIIRALCTGLGKRPRLFPVPESLLQGAASLAGKGDRFAKICGSLEVDASKIRQRLGWEPRATFASGLAEAARSCSASA